MSVFKKALLSNPVKSWIGLATESMHTILHIEMKANQHVLGR